ncbi:FxLYD domain-containing protein [Bacillus sp. SM2101]|uniref:FxLYD domain-containing protein n=1 Tax=Bacillus sp. SM2101 TaxID=2805366 RepID=UPI001BDF5E89|nr:FxLYD domain-containing protein [Bacillus sp. SM2101]
MKKLSALLVFMSVLLLFMGCSNDEKLSGASGGSASPAEDSNTEEVEETSGVSVVEVEEEEAEVENVSLEIVQDNGIAWVDSIGTIWLHSAAIYENTGEVPIKIGETQMNFKDQEGGILGTATWIYAVPNVVLPGEKAFVSESAIIDGITDASLYKETTYNFEFNETTEDPNLMEVSAIKGVKGDEWTPYRVTGLVKNTKDEKQESISVAGALYAEDGTLLGILNDYIDVGLNPGNEAGFELLYPDIPIEFADQVATIEVMAYGWND